MNSLGEPTCLDELHCVQVCPALLPALTAGDFTPAFREGCRYEGATWERVEDIGRFREPGKREVHVYRLQRLTLSDGTERWRAFGEYCWGGRTADDADYTFLDGGGTFATRAAAEWTIHIYLAHLYAEHAGAAPDSYGRI